jgi:hypothetical protein
MSPKSFTFKLTVPRDPQALSVVAVLAGHSVTYAEMEAAAGADFVARVEAAGAQALQSTGAASLHIVVTSDADVLTFAIDGAPVSAHHSA